MPVKIIMVLSAIFLGLLGLALTFIAPELSNFLLLTTTPISELFIQLLGALYFALAMLNWMAKGNVIGGIYNRPIAIANFTHFFIGALALLKTCTKNDDLPVFIWVLTGFYAVFSLLFGRILFRAPVKSK